MEWKSPRLDLGTARFFGRVLSRYCMNQAEFAVLSLANFA